MRSCPKNGFCTLFQQISVELFYPQLSDMVEVQTNPSLSARYDSVSIPIEYVDSASSFFKGLIQQRLDGEG